MFEASLPELIGIIGAIIYLLSYAAIQWKRDFVRTIEYSFMNFTAAACVLFSLTTGWNIATAIVNIAWLIISAYGIYRCSKYILNNRQIKPIIPEQEEA